MAAIRRIDELKAMLQSYGFREEHRVAFDTGYFVHMWVGRCILFVCTWENRSGWDVYLPVDDLHIDGCIEKVKKFIEERD